MNHTGHEFRKIAFDVLVAVILAVIAAIAVEVIMHAPAAETLPACDANFQNATMFKGLPDCGGHPATRREVRV